METGPIRDTKTSEFKMPAGSCDTHAHIFGPVSRFPFAPDWSNRGFDAPEEWLSEMHGVVGVERCVIVHGRPHGFDLRVTLDAMARDSVRYRGVALLNPDDENDNIPELHDAGFRGVRFNLMGGAPDLDKIGGLLSRVEPYGWHVCFHMASGQIIEYEAFLKGLGIEIVFDHLLRIDPADGLDQGPFDKLREFLEAGRSWVKLSAFERMSHGAYPYEDVLPFARVLMEEATERVLWATDWPHNLSGPAGPPEDGGIVDLIPLFAETEEQQRKLLVENPDRLYGFTSNR